MESPPRHSRRRMTLAGIGLLLALMGVPMLLGWGLQALAMGQIIRPGCKSRCATRGQGLSFIAPSSRGPGARAGGCVCDSGDIITWSAPDRVAEAQLLLFPTCFALVGLGAALRARRHHHRTVR